ncbi:MAG: hypothetical protein MUC36_08365, partial [Planctomycetes bacterium]|nr:hypothetical protein [Planctomycetota bacterium]
MNGSFVRDCVGAAVMTCAAVVGVVSSGVVAGSPNLEVRDDAGKLRCLLGRLAEGEYGLMVFGEDQQEFRVSLEESGMVRRGQVKKDASFELL